MVSGSDDIVSCCLVIVGMRLAGSHILLFNSGSVQYMGNSFYSFDIFVACLRDVVIDWMYTGTHMSRAIDITGYVKAQIDSNSSKYSGSI